MVKVKLSLCLTKHHAMKTYLGVEVKLHAFLTSALDAGERSASRPGLFTLRVKAPGTHWIGDWVDYRIVTDAMGFHNCPWRESNTGRQARSLVSVLSQLLRLFRRNSTHWMLLYFLTGTEPTVSETRTTGPNNTAFRISEQQEQG
jgi:hypothetical protein